MDDADGLNSSNYVVLPRFGGLQIRGEVRQISLRDPVHQDPCLQSMAAVALDLTVPHRPELHLG